MPSWRGQTTLRVHFIHAMLLIVATVKKTGQIVIDKTVHEFPNEVLCGVLSPLPTTIQNLSKDFYRHLRRFK
jgi:hypothetical protein